MNKNEKILFFSGKLTRDDDLNKISKNICTQIVDESGYGFILRNKIWYRIQLKNNFSLYQALFEKVCKVIKCHLQLTTFYLKKAKRRFRLPSIKQYNFIFYSS